MKLEEKEYREMDKKIRPLVRSLHAIGVATTMSCQGHRAPGKHAYPWVTIDVEHTLPEAMQRLVTGISDHQFDHPENLEEIGLTWVLTVSRWFRKGHPCQPVLVLSPYWVYNKPSQIPLKRLQKDAGRLARALSAQAPT